MAEIKLIGVGRAGIHVVESFYLRHIPNVDCIGMHVDDCVLDHHCIYNKLVLGRVPPRGLDGPSTSPQACEELAEVTREGITSALRGAELVLIVAGFGSGTGSGAVPVIARYAQEIKALTISIITTPFSFEGRIRARNAAYGIQCMMPHVDMALMIPCDRVLPLIGDLRTASLKQAFGMLDHLLAQGVQGILDFVSISEHGAINFADLQLIASHKGKALIGVGRGSGAERASHAAQMAMSSPFLQNSLDQTKEILVSIIGGTELDHSEIDEVIQLIAKRGNMNANLHIRTSVDPKIGSGAEVTVIAVGVENKEKPLDQ